MSREQTIKTNLAQWYYCCIKQTAYRVALKSDEDGYILNPLGGPKLRYIVFCMKEDGFLESSVRADKWPDSLKGKANDDATFITEVKIKDIDTSKPDFDMDGEVDYPFPDPKAFERIDKWVDEFVDDFKKE